VGAAEHPVESQAIKQKMAIFGDKFKCARCGSKTEPIGFAPVPTELGTKIGEEMCKECWAEWQKKQMQLINHFGLDVSNPDSHQFLFDNMKIFFYDEGVNLAEIDTSKEGKVNW
jgi:Fe-S cluster biosynthesis and repair protein YggX